jgi:hypothetical protein
MSPIERSGGGGGGSSLGVIAKTTLTSGNLSTSSTTFVNATGVAVTATTGANRCLVNVLASVDADASGLGSSIYTCLDVAIDTVRQGQAFGLTFVRVPLNIQGGGNGGFSFVTDVLTAASHTFQVMWRVTAGSSTLYASTTVCPAIISVIDLGRT